MESLNSDGCNSININKTNNYVSFEKMKNKYITLSKQFQNPIEKS